MNAQHKNFKTFAVLVYGHVYIIMVILRSQIKITNFFMILAWASPFNILQKLFETVKQYNIAAQVLKN